MTEEEDTLEVEMGEVKDAVEVENRIRRRYFRGRTL